MVGGSNVIVFVTLSLYQPPPILSGQNESGSPTWIGKPDQHSV